MSGGTSTFAGPGVRHVFVRNMVVLAAIGVYPHEEGGAQRVRVNVDLAVVDEADGGDRLSRVVDYGLVVETIRALVAAGHVKLVETLGERIAAACLVDKRVLRARVRVEKLDVFDDVESVGVELERNRAERER